MKLVFVPILTLLMLIQTFSQWVIVAQYQLNKEYIARVLCVNRAKPASTCKGKCQLNKRISATESDTPKGKYPPMKVRINEIDLEINKRIQLIIFTLDKPARLFAHYSETIPLNLYPAVFHPPSIA